MIKKILAPLLITCIIVLYFLLVIFGFVQIPESSWLKFVGIALLLFFVGVSIYVLVERIKEIKGGEEDDLSKY